MRNNYCADLVSELTGKSIPSADRASLLKRFAEVHGWLPSDVFSEYSGTELISNGHLLIEHGLDNTAVITFLQSNRPFTQLAPNEQSALLTISYNNLVDWHLFPNLSGQTFVHNRTKPIYVKHASVTEHPDAWCADAFDRIAERKPNPNFRALDDALIDTLSFWKRTLAGELGDSITVQDISKLFNCLIFIRALEDHRRKRTHSHHDRLLVDRWNSNAENSQTIRNCIKTIIDEFGLEPLPVFINLSILERFDRLSIGTVQELFSDLYDNRYAPYRYDFSLMSKHALSRIYEHYVSLVRERNPGQQKLFPDLAEEIDDSKARGEVYTPQFIARFFTRFLKEHTTPAVFRKLRSIDPSCGSGIFLRTLLEFQCDPMQDIDMRLSIDNLFKNVMGFDIDTNACEATRLSLSLLYLVLTDGFPENLNIEERNTLECLNTLHELTQSFDIVITNPPFIKWERMTAEMRRQTEVLMGNLSRGKPDSALVFLKLSLDLLKPGGFLLFVLPHSFLLSKNAELLRQDVLSRCWVRVLVDLSEIPVFGGYGSYVVLLILQKRSKELGQPPLARVARCRSFVGRALQDVLEDRECSNSFYDVYNVKQTTFLKRTWQVLTPTQSYLRDKLSDLPKLETVLTIREGFVTGADDIFILKKSQIPPGEDAVFIPYLRDREMKRYVVPRQTQDVVFYPYVEGKRITEEDLKIRFPQTWAYLRQHSTKLKSRKTVTSGRCEWWCPAWPRQPHHMLRPKIVSPHLVLLPRFSLDIKGRYGISRAPYMCPLETEEEALILRYCLATLNSTIGFWQITQISHKYSRGYRKLEPMTLKTIAIPDPTLVDANTMRQIQKQVIQCMKYPMDQELDSRLDQIVAELYKLSPSERIEIGMNE